MPKSRSGLSIALAVAFALITVVIWRWQTVVFHAPRDEVKAESWDHVKEEYPMPQDAIEPPQLSPEAIESVVRANPFSPKRRLVPARAGTNGAGAATIPLPPQFLYKGRINFGQHHRAVVEETTTHKTYFLEVGQEVAGFKVLDIAENRVVLSDLQTKQEVVVSLASPESQ